jgi:SPOR domain/PilZ domain
MLQDRRQSARLAPPSLHHLVQVGQHNTGFLFNLSEGGLAVDGLLPEIHDDVFSLALELGEANVQIVATAQAAWTSNSGHRTGMRFVHLSDSSRRQLKEWVSARAAAAELEPAYPVLLAPMSEPSSSLPRPPALPIEPQLDFASVPRQLTLEPSRTKYELPRKQGNLRRTLSLILTIPLISAALVRLGYYLGNKGGYRTYQTLAAAPKLPDLAAPPPIAAQNSLAAPLTSLPATLSLNNPGFVLQVAAMEHEDNADALSNSLQEKHFPAFVFKRSSERLYKVAVGSYPDADSAAAAQRELEKHGFTAIILRWSPQ